MDNGFIPDDYESGDSWNRSEETWKQIDKLQTEEIKQLNKTIDQQAEIIDKYKRALEIISLYVAFNGDRWPAECAEDALKGVED